MDGTDFHRIQLHQCEIDFVKNSTYSKSIPSFHVIKAKILCSYML